MVIFLNLDGSCQKITPERIYQGSSNVTDVTVVAPFPATTAMQIGFILPNGLYWTNSTDGSRYSPMEQVEQSMNEEVSVWHYTLPGSVTKQMGDLYVAINAVTAQGDKVLGNKTSYMCKVQIEESVLPDLPEEPDPSVDDLLLLYIARLDARTVNVPNLVAKIQKVKDANNAFTYTDNSGVISAPIVLGDPYAAPIPVNAASTLEIPETAWQPTYAADNTTITGYTYLLTAGLHGQMRDGATATDLWVSFDETATGGFKGVTADYTVNASGDITISVNTAVAMTVRVWNGKGLVDEVARKEIADETTRAETAEENLQQQITELVNTGVDAVARAAVAAETERAEAAEAALQVNLNSVRDDLQSDIQSLETSKANTDGVYPNMTAGKATALQNPRTIDGVAFSGIVNISHYGICFTNASTSEKTITMPNWTGETGSLIVVNFRYVNTVSSPTLNVNGKGAFPLICKDRTTDLLWKANETMMLFFNGDQWEILFGYTLADRPVGSYHIQFNGEDTPATRFGGTWTVDTAYVGQMLRGSSAAYIGNTGGVAQHNHGFDLYAMLELTGNGNIIMGTKSVAWDSIYKLATGGTGASTSGRILSATNVGGDIEDSENIPPYINVVVWKRTA